MLLALEDAGHAGKGGARARCTSSVSTPARSGRGAEGGKIDGLGGPEPFRWEVGVKTLLDTWPAGRSRSGSNTGCVVATAENMESRREAAAPVGRREVTDAAAPAPLLRIVGVAKRFGGVVAAAASTSSARRRGPRAGRRERRRQARC